MAQVFYELTGREHTAVPDYFTEPCALEERVKSRYGGIQALRRKVDRTADGAALTLLSSFRRSVR